MLQINDSNLTIIDTVSVSTL